jgi:hypothetical protein
MNLMKRNPAHRPSRYHQAVPTTKIQIRPNAGYFHARKYAGSEIGRSAARMNVNNIPMYWKLGIRMPTKLIKQAERCRDGRK